MREDPQFKEANADIERAIVRFITAIERTMVRRDSAAPTYVAQVMLKGLCEELTKLIDNDGLVIGSAEIKLSNALADYRDLWLSSTQEVDLGRPFRGEV